MNKGVNMSWGSQHGGGRRGKERKGADGRKETRETRNEKQDTRNETRGHEKAHAKGTEGRRDEVAWVGRENPIYVAASVAPRLSGTRDIMLSSSNYTQR